MIVFLTVLILICLFLLGYIGYFKYWIYKEYKDVKDYIPQNNTELLRQDALLQFIEEILRRF